MNRAWERRFRLPIVLATQIAHLRPERGLAIAVTGRSYQLHAWQVPEERLTQLTFGSANVQRGHLAPDGGPFTVQRDWYFLPAETWLDAGFAFLALNYRGSTTFGREFERAIVGDAGHLELEDMAAAHRWLVAHSIARGPDLLARALLWRLPHAAWPGHARRWPA